MILKITGSTLTNVILTIVLLGSVLFVGITSSQVTYDPLLDVTGDGYGGIDDIVAVAEHFGASGTPINWTQLLQNVSELQSRVTALEEQSTSRDASYYANTETYMTDTTGSVTITFPSGTFATTPNMSVTGVVLSGSNAGKPLYFADITISTDSVTLDLQYWDGAAWQDLGASIFVQLSLTAVEISTTHVIGFNANTVNTFTDTSGNAYISYPLGYFLATPQHLAVTAQFNSGGIAQMGHVTVFSHDQFGFWINVKDGTGSNWNGNVQISYTAILLSD